MVVAMTRRAWLATAIGVTATVSPVTARTGVHLTGRLDATESEQTEHIANFGKALALVVRDRALWDQVAPMLGREVQISIFTP